jgi:hypothetical protein
MDKNKFKKFFSYLMIGGFVAGFIKKFLNKERLGSVRENFNDLYSSEKKEVNKLVEQKEDFGTFFKKSCGRFHSYFIPAECNGYKPKILRSKQLTIITIALLAVKIALTVYLFAIYPNMAKMSKLMVREVFDFVNSERQGVNLNTLTFNDKLNQAAEAKANDMINKDYFAHKSPDGKMPWDWVSRKDYPYLYMGENLAMNFTSAESAHNALMLSPTHKKNILNSKYTEIGVAIATGDFEGKNTNILVELFGHKQGEELSQAKPQKLVQPIKDSSAGIAKLSDKPSVLSAENENNLPDLKNLSAKPASGKTKNIEVPEVKASPVVIDAGIEEAPAEAAVGKDLQAHLLDSAREIRVETYSKVSFAAALIRYSKIIFSGALIFMVMALFANIFIKISVQHKPVIIQSLLVIVFIIGLLSVKIHFLEHIVENIVVAGL